MGKLIIGTAMVIAGIAAGYYVAIVICLIGGIWDLIHFAQGGYVSIGLLTWGVLKIMFMTAAGTLAAYGLVIPGFGVIATMK